MPTARQESNCTCIIVVYGAAEFRSENDLHQEESYRRGQPERGKGHLPFQHKVIRGSLGERSEWLIESTHCSANSLHVISSPSFSPV
jgi:hypothetical protein